MQIVLFGAALAASRQTFASAYIGGCAHAGADRALVTEFHPVLDPISRKSPITSGCRMLRPW
jgi:hypothetical protein